MKSVLAASVLALGLAGCAADTDKTTTESGAKVIEDGKLTVCTHMPYEPFQYNQGGEVVGFDVEMMDLVAEELGLEQKIFDTPFEGIETGQAMATGKCDVAAAGMTITDERAEVMDFSDPYFDATQALLVKKGADISSLEDLAGKSLAVQVGTTGQKYAVDNAPEGVEIRDFEDLALLTQAVKNGQVDAGINDNTVLYDYVEDNPDTEVVGRVRHRRAVRLRGRPGRKRRAVEDRQRRAGEGEGGRDLRRDLQEVLRRGPSRVS